MWYSINTWDYNVEKQKKIKTLQVLFATSLLRRIGVPSLAGDDFMGQIKLYQDRDWLYKQRIVLKKSTPRIAKEQNTSHKTILYWIKKFNIKKEIPLYQDKNWLNNQYWNLNKSELQIGKEQKVSGATVGNWLIKLGISKRPKGESIHLANTNHVNLTPKAIEVFSGLLLGDGHLEVVSQWSAIYSHNSKYKEYVEWLSIIFKTIGIKQCKQGSYHYASLSYPELLLLQQKWYRLYNPETDPKNWHHKLIKIVPMDLKLTPTVCLHWYIGDGCLQHVQNKTSLHYCNCIVLATMGFPTEDVEFLVKELNKLGFKCHRTTKNEIYISAESTPAFLKYIGNYPIDCYRYKWELK